MTLIEQFPCQGCSRRLVVTSLCENGAYCWDCCGSRHRDDPECARWRKGLPLMPRGAPTQDYISGYLAALNNLEHQIRVEENDERTLLEWIDDEAERMSK